MLLLAYLGFCLLKDIREQREELIWNQMNGALKIFARVEFEHANLPSSLTWTNYDLFLFKENFKDLYETKNLSDILIKVVRKMSAHQSAFPSPFQTRYQNHFHPYLSAKMKKRPFAGTDHEPEPKSQTTFGMIFSYKSNQNGVFFANFKFFNIIKVISFARLQNSETSV